MIPPSIIFIFIWLLFISLIYLNLALYKKNKSKKILFFSIIVWFVIFYVLFINILYPSYLSYDYACNQDYEKLNNSGYIVTGTTSCNDNKVEIRLYNKDPKTLNHELCHYLQKIEKRNFGCSGTGIGLYLNEVECYILSNIDYKIWSNITI